MKPPASHFYTFVVLFCTVTAALLLPCLSQASVINGFQSREYNGGQDFNYNYPTPAGQPQPLSFRLNMSDIARGSREFSGWDDDAAKDYAFTQSQKYAASISTPNMKVNIDKTLLGTRIEVEGRGLQGPQAKALMEKIQNDIQTQYEQGIYQYATSHYYRVIPKGKRNNLMPNHAAIAVRYTPAMGPVAKAILTQVPGANAGPRAFINAALNWLQTIPYDTLQDRYTSNGAGFQTPYGLMQGNLGDCDTKAVALAALIRAAYPSIPLTMVYVPEHAFLGIGLPQSAEDYALQTTNGTFILADATGPGLTPLGYIDERTRTGVRSHQTELLPIP